jgi:hypothetical protein
VHRCGVHMCGRHARAEALLGSGGGGGGGERKRPTLTRGSAAGESCARAACRRKSGRAPRLGRAAAPFGGPWTRRMCDAGERGSREAASSSGSRGFRACMRGVEARAQCAHRRPSSACGWVRAGRGLRRLGLGVARVFSSRAEVKGRREGELLRLLQQSRGKGSARGGAVAAVQGCTRAAGQGPGVIFPKTASLTPSPMAGSRRVQRGAGGVDGSSHAGAQGVGGVNAQSAGGRAAAALVACEPLPVDGEQGPLGLWSSSSSGSSITSSVQQREAAAAMRRDA